MSSVSVVLPSYNRARWLPATVASILQQTRRPDEILIVDDGSTDDTERVCAQFPHPVRYLRQENGGVSAARNRGIQEAAGEWIALADSDDLWEPTKLEVQLAALAACEGTGWSLSGCTVIGLDDAPVAGVQSWPRVFPVFRELQRTPDAHFAEAMERRIVRAGGEPHDVYCGSLFSLLFYGNVGLPSSLVIRRDLFDRVGGFDEAFRVAEETEFFHRVAAVSPAAVVMSPLVRYRTAQSDSLTANTNVPRLVKNALTSIDRAARLRPELSPEERRAYRSGRERAVRRLAYAQFSLLDGPGARTTLLSAWREGYARSLGSVALCAATLVPASVLGIAHRLKRGLRA